MLSIIPVRQRKHIIAKGHIICEKNSFLRCSQGEFIYKSSVQPICVTSEELCATGMPRMAVERLVLKE